MYRKILVPLDGSELSECSLQHVRAIATGCNVPEVVLLRVVEPLSAQAVSSYLEAGPTGADLLTKTETQNKADAEDYISKLSEKLKREGIAAQTAIVDGWPADVILDYAKNNHIDLIVMSTHGRAGISRWAFGSAADRVIRHSVVPVLVVSPPGCRISQ